MHQDKWSRSTKPAKLRHRSTRLVVRPVRDSSGPRAKRQGPRAEGRGPSATSSTTNTSPGSRRLPRAGYTAALALHPSTVRTRSCSSPRQRRILLHPEATEHPDGALIDPRSFPRITNLALLDAQAFNHPPDGAGRRPDGDASARLSCRTFLFLAGAWCSAVGSVDAALGRHGIPNGAKETGQVFVGPGGIGLGGGFQATFRNERSKR